MRNDRTEVLTGHYFTGFIAEHIDDVVNRSNSNHRRSRHAALTCTTRHRSRYIARGHTRMGIGQNNQMILCTAQRQTAFEVRSRAFIDDFRHFCRANEGNGFNIGMVAYRFHNVAVAVHDVQNAIGQACFFQKGSKAVCTEGYLFRRFHNHRITQNERIRNRPIRHHAREIERHNRCHNAHWKPFGTAFNAFRHLHYFTLNKLRHRASKLSQFYAFFYFRLGFIVSFTIFLLNEAG